MGSCEALMSVRLDTPGVPDYYPGFSMAAIRRSSISFQGLIPARYLFTLTGLSVANVDQCLTTAH